MYFGIHLWAILLWTDTISVLKIFSKIIYQIRFIAISFRGKCWLIKFDKVIKSIKDPIQVCTRVAMLHNIARRLIWPNITREGNGFWSVILYNKNVVWVWVFIEKNVRSNTLHLYVKNVRSNTLHLYVKSHSGLRIQALPGIGRSNGILGNAIH